MRFIHVGLGIGFVFAATAFQNCSPNFKAESATLSSAGAATASPLDMSVALGKSIYASNCASCHGQIENTTKAGRSVSQLSQALSAVPQMSFLASQLSSSDLKSLADALANGSLAQRNPFTCASSLALEETQLHRLTNDQLKNVIIDLFAGTVALAEFQPQLLALPDEASNASPVTQLFDTMNPASMTSDLLSLYQQLAAQVAARAALTPARYKLLAGSCMATSPVTSACITSFITGFGLRVYRRPLTAIEVASYQTLFAGGSSTSDSIASVLEVMLQSPDFLYLVETPAGAISESDHIYSLDSFSIASRISFAITGSLPDAELFRAAAAGELLTDASRQSQIDRLFQTAAARTHVQHFYDQWLRLNSIASVTATSAFKNGLDSAAIQKEASSEMVSFMNDLIWQHKGGYRDLMTSTTLYPNGPNLASVYGVAQSAGAVQTSDAQRAGLLTRVGMLMRDGNGNTRPVQRGIKIRMNLLCDTLGSPPANADELAATFDPLGSTRDQFTARTSPALCMTCHQQLNPLGFSLEHFDGFGRYRTTETVTYGAQSRDHTIDSTVDPMIEGDSGVTSDGAVALEAELLKSNKAPACFTKQWLQFETGRPATLNDGCQLSLMYDALNESGGSFYASLRARLRAANYFYKKVASP